MGKKEYYWKGLGCILHKGKKLNPSDPIPESLGKDFLKKHIASGDIEIRDYSVVETEIETDGLDDPDDGKDDGGGNESPGK